MSRLLIPSLIVTTMLAATIAWEVRNTPRYAVDDSLGHQTALNLAPAIPAPVTTDPVAQWVTTSLERPLLRDSRRPDHAPGDVAKRADDTLRLAGVVTGPFGDRAIFVLPGAAKPVIANVGAQLGGFLVRSIEPGLVVVETNGMPRTFKPMYSGVSHKQPVASRRS